MKKLLMLMILPALLTGCFLDGLGATGFLPDQHTQANKDPR